MNTDFKSRLARIKADYSLTQEQIAKELGVSRPYMSAVANGRYPYSESLKQKIDSCFPEGGKKETTKEKIEKIPFYDMDVTASYVEAFHDVKEEPSYMIDFAPVNDCTAAFPVYGESMAPGISSGDIVFVREIRNKVSLLWGEVYLVITDATCDNMRTIKRVYLSEDGKTYILRADNPLYSGDTLVPVESVIRIYIVKGSFTRKQL